MDILQEILKPYKYELIRADSFDRTGNIMVQVIQLIIESELAIVDLSGQNANVFVTTYPTFCLSRKVFSEKAALSSANTLS